MRQTIEIVTCEHCGKKHEYHPNNYGGYRVLTSLNHKDFCGNSIVSDFCDLKCCFEFLKKELGKDK